MLNLKLHIFQTNYDYRFSQQKALKESIAKNKKQLLDAAEKMNYRLWNFRDNIDNGWHIQNETEWKTESKYYIKSFVYLFLVFFYYVRKTEKDICYIDSTVATKYDYIYLKYLKTFQLLFCDSSLFKNIENEYDDSHATHHFFKHIFDDIPYFIEAQDEILSYTEFEQKIKGDTSAIEQLREYLSSAKNNENNHEFCVLRLFHLTIIAFLNTFGHDYQKTDIDKIKHLNQSFHSTCIFCNVNNFFERNKLHDDKQLKKTINFQ